MNYIRLFLMAALCMGLVWGCEDDKNTSPVGTWSLSSISATKSSGVAVNSATAPVWTELLVLNADGTFSYSANYNSSASSGHGTWGVENGIMTFSGSSKAFAYSVDGGSMTFTGTSNGDAYTLTWGRQ